jgi:hypothetical protein
VGVRKMNCHHKTSQFLTLGLVITLTLSCFPQIIMGRDPYILVPYVKIAKQASGESAYHFVEQLTQDDFEGREAGSAGCDKAAKWIVDQFKDLGLKPFQTNSYFQPVLDPHYLMEKKVTNNVIGYIPAVDPDVKESVLVTSHYDGLGIDFVSGEIYQGANDNASATACMLEVARILVKNHCLPTINIVFISFTGEEDGLLGSYYYVEHPLFPLANIKAVLNSEEVGTKDGLFVAGTSSSFYPELCSLITASAKLLQTKFQFIPHLLVPCSDHYPFHKKGIPSVMFIKPSSSNGFPQYHTLEDTIDIISPKTLEVFCQIITLLTLSYSRAAFFDTSPFSSNQKIIHPFVTISDRCYLPIPGQFVALMNQQQLDPSPGNQLELFIPLIAGENNINFDITYNNKIWIDSDFTLFCDPDPNLRADFNQDFRVNALDLAMLSKKIDSPPTKQYHYPLLFDLSQDQKVTEYDYQLFASFFGYSAGQVR